MDDEKITASSQPNKYRKILGFCFALACLFFFKWLFGSLLHGETLSPQFKSEMIRAGIESCLKRQSGEPENKDLTLGQINKYCNCLMVAQANDFTTEDVKSIRANNMVVPPALEKRIEVLSITCAEDLAKDIVGKGK
jgi:hypothetical protein